jgi:glutathione peroxidase
MLKRSLFSLFALVMMMTIAPLARAATAYDFEFVGLDGAPLPLDQFKGKVVLVVNTASACGFTPQYDGLQALYDDYRDQGLVVLGIPSNDFGRQEPLSAEGIKDFCEVNFNITFPMTDKTVVKGQSAHPFYQWAAAELGMMAKPRWNFHKYLIDREGKLVNWFASTTSPQSAKLKKAIEAALGL